MDDNQHDEQLPLTTEAAIDAEPAAEDETDETPVAVDEVEVDEEEVEVDEETDDIDEEADDLEADPVVTTPPAPQFSASEPAAASGAAAAQPPRRRAASRPAGPPQIPATVFAVGEPITAPAPQTRTGTAAPVAAAETEQAPSRPARRRATRQAGTPAPVDASRGTSAQPSTEQPSAEQSSAEQSTEQPSTAQPTEDQTPASSTPSGSSDEVAERLNSLAAALGASSSESSDDEDDSNESRRPSRRRRGGRRSQRSAGGTAENNDNDESEDEDTTSADSTEGEHTDRRDSDNTEDDDTDTAENSDNTENSDDSEDSDDDGQPRRRRRRRGGRRRRRGSNDDNNDSQQSGDSSDNGDGDADDSQQGEGGNDDSSDDSGDGQSRRRRRRRSRTGGSSSSDSTGDDGITAIQGSTRLEAKRQRRREGRSAGRRRTPILSESEFLARRESVERKMIIRQAEEYSQIAVLEDGVLVEHYVDKASATSLIGNVYLGRIQNVLPSMEAAFIDIGRGRNAVLYAGEVDWDAFGAHGQDRKIEQVFKSGQTVLVQVTKDPVGAKGARLTSHISIPGRYVVYSPDGHLSGISRKLADAERKRLKSILDVHVGDKEAVIVRTAAEGASEEELVRDVTRLKDAWKAIEKKAKSGGGPHQLYTEPDLTVRIVRDLFTEDFSELIIDGLGGPDDAYERVMAYAQNVAPHLADRISRWGSEDETEDDQADANDSTEQDAAEPTEVVAEAPAEDAAAEEAPAEETAEPDEAPKPVPHPPKRPSPADVPARRRGPDVFEAYRIDEQIAKALERAVYLPSGGSLIIDRTEAMTVIDVNTGKFTGKGGNLESTITSNNLEAAEEIVRQLRLRDIGGIIVVDFIDMVLPANRELLLRRLVECLGRDRTRHQVSEVTSLGLVQMTRKKIGTGLAEAFTETCEHCEGRGYHTHDAPVDTQAPADGGDRNNGGGNRRGRRRKN